MTEKTPSRNQEPEPVRPWFARLFRLPTRSTVARHLDVLAAEPAPDRILRLTQDLTTALADAARWKRHADSYDSERGLAVQAFEAKIEEVETLTKERDGAYRERAQLLAWITALHPATTVITASPDVDEDGWQLLYLVAGGWQMSWHIHPRDADLFKHVTVVDVTDPRAQWDGHGTAQKYERMRGHVRLLALDGLAADGALTGVTANTADIASGLRANWARFRGHVLHEVWEALRDSEGGPLTDGMTVVNGLLEQAQTGAADSEVRSA